MTAEATVLNMFDVFDINEINAHHEKSKLSNKNHYSQYCILLNLHSLLRKHDLDFQIAFRAKDFQNGKGIEGVVICKNGRKPNLKKDLIDTVDVEGGCYRGQYMSWKDIITSYIFDNPKYFN